VTSTSYVDVPNLSSLTLTTPGVYELSFEAQAQYTGNNIAMAGDIQIADSANNAILESRRRSIAGNTGNAGTTTLNTSAIVTITTPTTYKVQAKVTSDALQFKGSATGEFSAIRFSAKKVSGFLPVTTNGSPNVPSASSAPTNIANLAIGGVIGTAATTIDVSSYFRLNQTTTGQSMTMPTPTLNFPRTVNVRNVGTASFTMY
jgi:hypothetical protein